MELLKINFETLDGHYNLIISNDHTYTIETNIEVLESKNGIVNNYDEFEKKLNEVNILSWDESYVPNGSQIDDAVKWSVSLDNYSSSGVEGYWPYNYDELIEILELIDDNVIYFKANVA